MSKSEVVFNQGNMMIVNTDTTKIFVWNNRYDKALMNNATYDPITVPEGTVLGRISATGKVKPLTSGASDGSQFPVGIAGPGNTVIDDGTDGTIYFCVDGDVVEGKVLLQGSDTLNTVVSGIQIRDRLKAQGIKLVSAEQQTHTDNQ